MLRSKASRNSRNQKGVNTVDLMMWLGISGLLLATAMQGTAYYQQAAYVHQMKVAVGQARDLVALEVANNDGRNLTTEDLDVVIENANNEHPDDDVIVSWDPVSSSASSYSELESPMVRAAVTSMLPTAVAPEGTYMLRAEHSEANTDVIYVYKDNGTHKDGYHVVGKGAYSTPSEPVEETPSPVETSTPAPTTEEPSPEPTVSEPEPIPTVEPTPEPTVTEEPTPSPSPSDEPTAEPIVNETIVAASGSVYEFFSDQSALEQTKETQYNIGTVSGADASKYTAEWSVGSGVNAKVTGKVGSNSDGDYWIGEITPADSRGFIAGTAGVTLKLTNISTGVSTSKTWNFTVNTSDIHAHSEFPLLFLDQTTKPLSKDTKTFVYTLPGAMGDYTVAYTATDLLVVNATYSTRVDSSKKYWAIDVKPKSSLTGYVAGVTYVTAKATHNATGKVYTKTFKLTVSDLL